MPHIGGGGLVQGVPVFEGGQGWGGGLYSEVQYIMDNGHMGIPEQKDRNMRKHYLLATSLAGGKYVRTVSGSYQLPLCCNLYLFDLLPTPQMASTSKYKQ